jgi:hypothetical protein
VSWALSAVISDLKLEEIIDQQPFRRGDPNADGAMDISDAIAILGTLFLGEALVPCKQAGDANDDGVLGISDGIYVLDFQFLGGEAIPPPYGICGVDPTGHPLPCEEFQGCPYRSDPRPVRRREVRAGTRTSRRSIARRAVERTADHYPRPAKYLSSSSRDLPFVSGMARIE